MPQIISSTKLRNNYNAVSQECHASPDPVFVTKNGVGDLAVMGIDQYEQMKVRLDFYEFLLEGRRDVEKGRVSDAHAAASSLRERYGI
ncbi:MAG: type II toxin-antitoxin system Phd/YefM family antitoxin [Coriobacteriia bacterium]|nr:type II toxin-antitoxin system Phd/YefM family antitoxin [Coriobacteriia bacterium]